MSSKFYVPTKGVRSWQELLAEPEKHWKEGYSACELANAWEKSKGFPLIVAKVLKSSPQLKNISFLLGIPEHQVSLKGGSRPSCNDIWVLGKTQSSLVSIAVEGKVHEPFGETLEEWNDQSAGKLKRLDYLCETLGVCQQPPGNLRYQLFHRTASAVIEAERFNALHAVMLVHTFFTDSARDSFGDYCEFLNLFSLKGIRNGLVTAKGMVGQRKDITLHFGWVEGS